MYSHHVTWIQSCDWSVQVGVFVYGAINLRTACNLNPSFVAPASSTRHLRRVPWALSQCCPICNHLWNWFILKKDGKFSLFSWGKQALIAWQKSPHELRQYFLQSVFSCWDLLTSYLQFYASTVQSMLYWRLMSLKWSSAMICSYTRCSEKKHPLVFSCITLRKSNQFESKFQTK